MLATYLLPLLPTILAAAILPPTNPHPSSTNTTTTLPTRRGTLGLPDNLTPLSSTYNPNNGCTYHTTVLQKCETGALNTYITLSRPLDAQGIFTYFDGRPTFGVPNIRYLPGVTQAGPKLWKDYKGKFESTWYGDHMPYSYHGPSWSDGDPNFCKRGEWTAGPLRCDVSGSLGWRTYDSDCFFKCIW